MHKYVGILPTHPRHLTEFVSISHPDMHDSTVGTFTGAEPLAKEYNKSFHYSHAFALDYFIVLDTAHPFHNISNERYAEPRHLVGFRDFRLLQETEAQRVRGYFLDLISLPTNPSFLFSTMDFISTTEEFMPTLRWQLGQMRHTAKLFSDSFGITEQSTKKALEKAFHGQ